MYFTSDDDVIDASRKEIENLITISKGEHEFDALMCYSGGKDSTYTLMLAVKKYGLNVLSFTFDNGFISPFAFDNIKRCVDYLGICHITVRPSIKFMKKLIRATSLNPIYNQRTLTRISANCNTCISIVNNMALKFALEKDIPYIIAGFTLGQIPSNSILYKINYEFLRESRAVYLSKLRGLVGNEIDDYFCISDDLIRKTKQYPYNLNLLCLENITENKIIEEIKRIGWQAPEDVDGCSSNCYLNTFNNFIHQKTLGYNPYELELSHLIRKGKLTREEALKKMEDQPIENINKIIEELEITEEEVRDIETLYKRI